MRTEKLTKLSGKVVTVNGKKYFRFETSVLGSFVLAEEAKLDAPIKEQNEQPDYSKVIAGVKATTIKAKSELNKHSVKLTWSKSRVARWISIRYTVPEKDSRNLQKSCRNDEEDLHQ